jgi:sugar/nucleoside kinase (ribokinase family)
MANWDIITFGDLCVDFILSGHDIKPEFGQKEKMIDSYSMLMGGSAPIVACQCAKLGLKTAIVGRLGEDAFGQLIRDELARAGVDTQFVTSGIDVKTGVTCILQGDDDRAMLTMSGSIGAVGFADAPQSLRQSVRHVHISSYYLMEQLQSGYPEFLRELKSHGATVSLDTNWDPTGSWGGLKSLEPYVDVFIPNENEARAITGEQDVSKALEALSKRFPVVAVKLGEKGAAAIAGGQHYAAEAYKVPFVDAVGAGDSFDGGFLYGWLSGKPMEDCLRAACWCGSQNVTGRGGTAAQPLRHELPEGLR